MGLASGALFGTLSGFFSALNWTSDLSSGVAGGVMGAAVGACVGVVLSIIGVLIGLAGYASAKRLGMPGAPIGAVVAGLSVAGLVALLFYGDSLSVALLTPATLVVGTSTAIRLLPSWSDSTGKF